MKKANICRIYSYIMLLVYISFILLNIDFTKVNAQATVPKPRINGGSTTYTVSKGKSISLSGVINSTVNLAAITVNQLGNNTNIYTTGDISSSYIKSFDLSKIVIDTNQSRFSNPGIYKLNIWARPVGITAVNTLLRVITLTINNPVTAVTRVRLNKAITKINVGYSETLTVTVLPTNATNKAVRWKSSNTAVATVDANGKVTGISGGTALITVTTSDGSKIASCTVRIAPTIAEVYTVRTTLNVSNRDNILFSSNNFYSALNKLKSHSGNCYIFNNLFDSTRGLQLLVSKESNLQWEKIFDGGIPATKYYEPYYLLKIVNGIFQPVGYYWTLDEAIRNAKLNNANLKTIISSDGRIAWNSYKSTLNGALSDSNILDTRAKFESGAGGYFDIKSKPEFGAYKMSAEINLKDLRYKPGIYDVRPFFIFGITGNSGGGKPTYELNIKYDKDRAGGSWIIFGGKNYYNEIVGWADSDNTATSLGQNIVSKKVLYSNGEISGDRNLRVELEILSNKNLKVRLTDTTNFKIISERELSGPFNVSTCSFYREISLVPEDKEADKISNESLNNDSIADLRENVPNFNAGGYLKNASWYNAKLFKLNNTQGKNWDSMAAGMNYYAYIGGLQYIDNNFTKLSGGEIISISYSGWDRYNNILFTR